MEMETNGNGSAEEHPSGSGPEEETEAGAGEERKIFIGGLSWETREPQLKEYFEKFGAVESANLKMNPATGKSRCFAFVVFRSAGDVDQVFAAGEHVINSKKVDVKRAKAKPGKLFVGGLKPELTDDVLREFFGQFGKITDFDMIVDKATNARKGFGFITFEKEDVMKNLINKKQVTIGEHTIDLRKATPKPDRHAGADFYGYPNYRGFDYYGGGYGGTGYGAEGFNYYGSGWGAAGPTAGGPGGGKIRGRGGFAGGVVKRGGGAPY
jgi:squid-like protein